MLLDKSHYPWGVCCAAIGLIATGLYVWADSRLPSGLTGGSVTGLWFGIVGMGMMVFAALLSAPRLFPDRLRITSVRVLFPLALGLVPLVGVAVLRWSDAELTGRGNQRVLVAVLLAFSVVLALFGMVQVGPRRVWLKGHLWFGLLSGWFVVLHSGVLSRGFRLGGPLEAALWGLLALTLATGVVLVVLQQILPRMITDRFPNEVPVGQHPYACGLLQGRADRLIAELGGAGIGTPDAEDKESQIARVQTFYEAQVRAFLAMPYDGAADLANNLAAEAAFGVLQRGYWSPEDRVRLEELKNLCDQRRLLGEQGRLHHRLHEWLGWHVPFSAALLTLGVVHAVASLFY